MERVSCHLCGADDFSVLFHGQDRLHHVAGSFPIVQCRRCHLVYLNPRPDATSLAQYYPDEYSPYHVGDGLADRVQRWLRTREAARIRRMVPEGGRVLEVGCAAGDLLAPLKNETGLEVAGIEMSDYAASIARDKHGVTVHTGTVFDAPYTPASFDVVIMRHVLEHFPSPRDALQQVVSFLKPGGIALISTPNFDSIGRRIFKRFWYDLDTPRHLAIFSVTTLERLFNDLGLETLKVRHSALPNNWIHSVRYLLKALFGQRRVFRFFSFKNPLLLLLFLPMSLLEKLLQKSGRIEVLAAKLNEAEMAVGQAGR